MTVQDRVTIGSKMLDAHFPGWRSAVNLAFLRMHTCEDCIAGQVGSKFGTPNELDIHPFDRVMGKLSLSWAQAYNAGFHIYDGTRSYRGVEWEMWTELKNAWIQEIRGAQS